MDRENCWQLQCAELRQRGAYLYKSKVWSDCELQVDHVTIKAHKLILAMSSPVLAKMVYGSHVLKTPVPIYDVRVEVFNILLEYIYSDNLNLNCSKDACDLYYTAKKLRLPHVANECIKYLNDHMCPENVCHIYSAAWENNDGPLQSACQKIFSTRTKEIINDPRFYSLTMTMVSKLFSLDPLNIDNELDLYNAAVEYARQYEINEVRVAHKEEYRRKRIEREEEESRMEKNGDESQPQTEENTAEMPICTTPTKKAKLDDKTENNSPTKAQEDNDNDDAASESSGSSHGSSSYYGPALFGVTIRDQKQKLEFRELIKPIRFLSLTPQEFAECRTLHRLLSSYEALCLSMNIASREATYEVPEGLSRSMVPRAMITQHERAKLAAVFRGIIPNFRHIKKYESPPLYVRNMAWTLMLLVCKDYVVLNATGFLETNSMEKEEWVKNAKIRLKFCTHKPTQLNKIGLEFRKTSTDFVVWSIKIHRNHIFNPEYGIIDDFNSVTYKLYIDTEVQDDSPRPYITNSNLKSVTESNSKNIILKVTKSPVLTTSASTFPSVTTSTVSYNATVISNRSTTQTSQDSTNARSSVTTPKTAPALPTPKWITSNTNSSKTPIALAQTMSAMHPAPALMTNTASRPSPAMATPLVSKTSVTAPSVLPQSKSSAGTSAGTKLPTVPSPAMTKPQSSIASNIPSTLPVGAVKTIPSSITKPQPSFASVASKTLAPATVTSSVKSPMMTLSSLAASLGQTPVTKSIPVKNTSVSLPHTPTQASTKATSSAAAPKILSHLLSATQSSLTPKATSNPLTAPKLPSSPALATKTCTATGLTRLSTSVPDVPRQSPTQTTLTTTATALKFPPPSPSNKGNISLPSQTIKTTISGSPISVKSGVRGALAEQSQPITSTSTPSSAKSTGPQVSVGSALQNLPGSSSMPKISVSSDTSKLESAGSTSNCSTSSSTVTNSIMPLAPYSYVVKPTDSSKKSRRDSPSSSKKNENLTPLFELKSLIASLKVPERFSTKKSLNDSVKNALTSQEGKVASPSDETNRQKLDATPSFTLPITEYPTDVEMVDMTITVRDPSPNFLKIDPYGDKPNIKGIKPPNPKLSMPELSEVDTGVVDTAQTGRNISPDVFDAENCDINISNAIASEKSPATMESVRAYEQDVRRVPPVWFPKTSAMVSSQPLHAVTRAWPTRSTVSRTDSMALYLVPKTNVGSPNKTIIVNERSSSSLNATSEDCSNISPPLKCSSNYTSPEVKKESSAIKHCEIYQPRNLRETAVVVLLSLILGKKQAAELYKEGAIYPKTCETLTKLCLTALDNSQIPRHVDAAQCLEADVKSDSFDIHSFFQPPTLMAIAISVLGPLVTIDFDHVLKTGENINIGVEQSSENDENGAVSNLKQPLPLKQVALKYLETLIFKLNFNLFMNN